MFSLIYTIVACEKYAEKIRAIQQFTGAKQQEAEKALAWAYDKGIYVNHMDVMRIVQIIEEYRKEQENA